MIQTRTSNILQASTIQKQDFDPQEISYKPNKTMDDHNDDTTSKRRLSRMFILRMIFVTSLIVAAVVCGYVSYTVIHGLEDDAAIQTYESVATSALIGAQAITARKVQGGHVMASILSYAFPSADQWPFIYLQGYSETSTEIAKLAASTSLALIMLVRPQQATEFETFAQDTYNDNGYADTAGRSEFGFGIYALNKDITSHQDLPVSTNYSDGRYPDTSGEILAPIFLHNIKNAKSLMFNVYSEAFRAKVLDSMIDCAEDAKIAGIPKPSCGVVTDWVQLVVRPGPASVLYQPIFPINDPNTMVAWTGTSIHWEEVLMNTVPNYVNGFHCIISSGTGTGSYTYVIHNGIPKLVGEGDLHDRNYDKYGRTAILNDIETGASISANYTLTVYPTKQMFREFASSSPMNVSLSLVGVISLCSVIFFLYDFLMKREAHQRKMILDVQRRFVRFVSHEIRTPLNIVCMGLELLQGELRSEIEKKKLQIDKDNKVDDSGTQAGVATASYWLDLTGDMLENSNSAVSILNDLLNYDKIQTGSFKLEIGSVDIWKLIRKTVAEFKIQSINRKVYLSLMMEEKHFHMEEASEIATDVEQAKTSIVDLDKLKVLGDDMRLTQVLRNLISNSLKFTPEGGQVVIQTTYKRDGLPGVIPIANVTASKAVKQTTRVQRAGSIVILVKDSGIGLTEDQLGQIFTEGLQFDASKLQAGGGSGFGLCIAKEIVKQHGGTIGVRSQGRDQGTSFTIELPLYQELRLGSGVKELSRDASQQTIDLSRSEATTAASSSSQRTIDVSRSETAGGCPTCTVASSSTTKPQHHHILVVDDVITNCKMLVRMLERAGHTCVVAHNGQEAIDAYATNQEDVQLRGSIPFDTILMDFEMPVMNGPDATKHLRDRGCNATIIGVTGNVLAEDVSYFKSHGADHVLPKPVKLLLLDNCWGGSTMDSL